MFYHQRQKKDNEIKKLAQVAFTNFYPEMQDKLISQFVMILANSTIKRFH